MSKILRIQEFAKLVGRTPQTIRRWEKEGKLVAKRLPSGHRYFLESDVQIVRDIPFSSEPVDRRTVVYCRVSSASQKKDLASQVRAMETFCLGAGIAVDDWIQEIGGGMNFRRKKFLELLDAVLQGKVKHVIVPHKDRLMRFGFDLFEHLATERDCKITVVNQESLSPQREMVEDLMAIVHAFSRRLYGLRKYRKQLREEFRSAQPDKETESR